MPRGGKFVPLAERIRRMSEVDEAGCWVWKGRPTNAGYGQMTIQTSERAVTRSAHRVSYELHIGDIPEGFDLDHLCRVRLCVNPAHLEPVTRRENILRSPISQAGQHARQTHCINGHPFDEENTYLYRGSRICRACRREAYLRRRNGVAA